MIAVGNGSILPLQVEQPEPAAIVATVGAELADGARQVEHFEQLEHSAPEMSLATAVLEAFASLDELSAAQLPDAHEEPPEEPADELLVVLQPNRPTSPTASPRANRECRSRTVTSAVEETERIASPRIHIVVIGSGPVRRS
jgi:hypothetical protein